MDGVAPIVSDEQMPPVGRNNVLDITQIRWCRREKIRIDAIEGLINNAYEREVSTFNAKVDDYNSRCVEFRYRRGQVEQVERELVGQRGGDRGDVADAMVSGVGAGSRRPCRRAQ